MTKVKRVGDTTYVFDGQIPGGMNARGFTDRYCDAPVDYYGTEQRCTRAHGHTGKHKANVNWQDRAEIHPAFHMPDRIELKLRNNHQSHSMHMSRDTALALADALREVASR